MVTHKNPMAATWTKAATVRRMFKAGRQRQNDLLYDSEEAILQGRISFLQIRKAMLAAGIATTADDLRAALVLMTPEGAESNEVYVLPIPRELAKLPELSVKVTKLEKSEKAVPLGLVFWQRDREAEDSDVWVQPWLVNPRAAAATIAARKAYGESRGNATTSTF